MVKPTDDELIDMTIAELYEYIKTVDENETKELYRIWAVACYKQEELLEKMKSFKTGWFVRAITWLDGFITDFRLKKLFKTKEDGH